MKIVVIDFLLTELRIRLPLDETTLYRVQVIKDHTKLS